MRSVFGGLALLVPAVAVAGPGTMAHQGRLLDPAGGPVNGSVTLTFSLYTAATGGSAVCSETETVTLADGYYSTVLGDGGCDLTSLDWQQTTYWSGVRVGTPGTEMLPRTELHAVPMAIASQSATSSGGGLIPPDFTTTERNSLSDLVPGQIIYNSTLGELQMYTGSDWVRIGADASTTDATSVFVGWGRNTTGELGNGSTTTDNPYVLELTAGLDPIAISAGGYTHNAQGGSCIIRADNTLWCAGRGGFIPDGTSANQTSFVQGGIGLQWRDVDVGSNLVACGVTTSNEAYCWGYQQYGALGNGSTASSHAYAPQRVNGGNPANNSVQWKEVRVGGRYNGNFHFAFSCGVTTATTGDNGFCWGRDDYGALGNGAGPGEHTTNPQASPLVGHTWKTIRPAQYHACGLTVDDEAFCWGEGADGRLGAGGTADRDIPTAVQGSRRYSQISPGQNHTCALTLDGQAYCWGDNGNGQLGDGTTTERQTPVPVLGGRRFKQISSGQISTCAIDTADTLWCWGDNSDGVVGDGSVTDRKVPTQVYGEYRFADIDLGYRHILGLTR